MFTVRGLILSVFLFSLSVITAGCSEEGGASDTIPSKPDRTEENRDSIAKGESFTMEKYAWKNRPLVVFAPSEEDSRYRKQRELIQDAEEGFRERDMVWIEVFATNDISKANGESLTAEEAEQLRRKFEVDENTFAAILVGKDTTVKRRSRAPVPAETLFEQIDRMPMRQREMKRSSSNEADK